MAKQIKNGKKKKKRNVMHESKKGRKKFRQVIGTREKPKNGTVYKEKVLTFAETRRVSLCNKCLREGAKRGTASRTVSGFKTRKSRGGPRDKKSSVKGNNNNSTNLPSVWLENRGERR